MTRDYVKTANDYIEKVLSGKIPACTYVKQACKRQQQDLKRRRWAYTFDPERASRPCRFIELLTHVKGDLAGQHLILEPWQIFILTTCFGWIDENGKRRFRNAYIEVPRKNGKTALSAGVGLYCLCADHEAGAEVYALATTREQAGEVFGAAQQMARANKALQSAYGLEAGQKAIFVMGTGSKFMAKSADASTLDGLNTSCGIIDELHAHKTRAVYDVVETSIGARSQPFVWCITTAGFNLTGICMERRRYVAKILAGSVKADEQFGIIYTIDDGDDWATEKALKKANPNWGVSISSKNILSLMSHAMTEPAAENNFKTKHLDIWCNADQAWMDMPKWRKCYAPGVELSEFAGRPCLYGIDLASKIDIAAVVKLFWRPEADGKVHYYVFPDFWLPSDRVTTSKNSQYEGWAKQGLLHVTDGPCIDLSEIEDFLRRDMTNYETVEAAFDPWQAMQLSQNLMADGAPMVELKPTVLNFSEPMKTLQALVYQKRLHTDGNPILEWMASNVVAHLDAKDNIYPRKETPDNKIDGMVALIMAVNRALALNVAENWLGTDEPISLLL